MLAMVPLRCLIVDDNASFLGAATALLEMQGLHIVGVAQTVSEGLQRVLELEPDVILVDIDLGGESGLDFVRVLADGRCRAPFDAILISTRQEEDYADLIAQSPARGFIAKSELSQPAVHAMLRRS
jgi:DNA-binding NarL/FixJ family response regulator